MGPRPIFRDACHPCNRTEWDAGVEPRVDVAETKSGRREGGARGASRSGSSAVSRVAEEHVVVAADYHCVELLEER